MKAGSAAIGPTAASRRIRGFRNSLKLEVDCMFRMCTASWISEPDGFHLLFNRDEKRSRKPALPPRLGANGGVQFIAPVDGDAGGSWIAVNEFGVVVCLLNGSNPSISRPLRSRGALVLDTIVATSAAGVCKRVFASDLWRFAPFTLVILQPGRQTSVVEWDGATTNFVASGDSL